MKMILKGPKTGKTTELIQSAAGCNGYLVVRDHSRAYSVVRRAIEMDLSINFPLTYSELMSGAFHRENCSPLWIDDVDELVFLLGRGAAVGGFSLTTRQ